MIVNSKLIRYAEKEERENYYTWNPMTDLTFFIPLKYVFEPRSILSLISKIDYAIQYNIIQ